MCPCKNCICVAICQAKNYSNLVMDCKLVFDYLSGKPFCSTKRKTGRLGLLYKTLKPIYWSLFSDNNGCAYVDNNMQHRDCHFYY